MEAYRKQNGMDREPNRANRKQTEAIIRITYVIVRTALVQYMKLNINNVLRPLTIKSY